MTLFFAAVVLVIVGGIAAPLLRRSTRAARIYYALMLAGCAAASAAAVELLATGAAQSATWRASTPGGPWEFGLDALSAVLVLAIAITGGAAAVYAHRYAGDDREHVVRWPQQSLIAFLLAAMWMVVAARAIVPFLVSWEAMAVLSYFALVAEHEHADVRRSGLIYLVATHTGTLALFAMFAVWLQPASSWTFAALAAAAPKLPHAGAIVLVLALVGFGFKAGFVPLHFWLPPAHSAAPTPVSALLSGVVIKLGVYGVLRVLLLVARAPAGWGWLVLGIGIASGVLGVLWALAQHDIKRLLAYHSVENIGIIFMGVGVGALGAAYGSPTIALLGYAGAVLHTLNHALFKTLLFLGAGAVYRATGTRDIEALGGLARRMPLTWLSFAIGSAAIIGIPPLNGFVSEWLVYRGLFTAAYTDGMLRLAVVGVPALALIGGLALACFAKASGVMFLGTPRSREAEAAREVAPSMWWSMLVVAAACVAIGVLPILGVVPAARAAAEIAHAADQSVLAPALSGAWAVSGVAAAVILVFGLMWLLRRFVSERQVRESETWGCGYSTPSPRMQYTASSFAAPLVSLFGRASGVRVHRTAHALHTEPFDLVLDRVALPAWNVVHRAAQRLRPIQQGRLHWYVLYVLAALLAMLVYLALGPRP